MDLQVISPRAAIAELTAGYDALAAAFGTAVFNTTLTAAFRDMAPVDRLYLFNFAGPAAIQLQIAEYETELPPTRHEIYISDYIPVDPILGAISKAYETRNLVLLKVRPQDIQQSKYRRALKSADIVERISIIRRDSKRCQCLNVARRSEKGPFTPDEIMRITNFAQLALPLAARHDEMIKSPRTISVAELERRFAALAYGLSSREIAVCARAAFGMSTEGTALDLNIGRASVLTYRKRAYARMAVTSVNELSRLVMN